MKQKNNGEFNKLILLNFFMLIFFVIMLLIGTFNDEAISKTLYSPDNLPLKLVTAIGAYPFFAFCVIFSGSLFERTQHSNAGKGVKLFFYILLVIFVTFIGFIGSGTLAERDSLGSIFPSMDRNIPVIIVISLVTIFPLCYLGYRLAKKSDDLKLVKHILCLFILLGIAYASLQVLKGIFNRPRYRLVVTGQDGIGFIPWYERFTGASEYIEKYGINKGEFRSFPSGHSILSSSMILCFQTLSWLCPKLKNKRFLLAFLGFIFSVIIMLSRIILGAHYLSDVSFGAVIVVILSFCYSINSMSRNQENSKNI